MILIFDSERQLCSPQDTSQIVLVFKLLLHQGTALVFLAVALKTVFHQTVSTLFVYFIRSLVFSSTKILAGITKSSSRNNKENGKG